MKKIWYVLFGVLCVLFVSGCGAQQIDATPEKTTTEDLVPDTVQDVFQMFQKAAAGNKDLVYISEPPQTAQFGGFEFPVFSDDTKRESLKVRFPRLDSDKRNLTIQILILRETKADFTVRTLTTCLYALGMDELSVAREKANQMMDSLAKSDFSEVVGCGDYMVLLSNVDNKTNIEAVYKATVWDEIDSKDYVAITNELYASNVQGKEIKVFAEGNVTS